MYYIVFIFDNNELFRTFWLVLYELFAEILLFVSNCTQIAHETHMSERVHIQITINSILSNISEYSAV